jgi:tRNA(Ile)-lysidine synthase
VVAFQRLKNSLKHNLKEHLLAKAEFPEKGSDYNIAVSGGPDSCALLVLATSAGLNVTVFHVNHSLRNDAQKEQDFVKELAFKYKARFIGLKVSVEPGPNLEARLRQARFSVLPDNIATAHSMDDQAETVIINLLRGAHLAGLSGMHKSFKHPLLEIRRSELRELCASEGINPIQDPTNKDMRFTRNRVRFEVIPLLNSVAKRDVVPIIARTAKLLRQEKDFIDSVLEPFMAYFKECPTTAPDVVLRRIIKEQISTSDGYSPQSSEIDRVLEVVKGLKPAVTISKSRQVTFKDNKIMINTYNSREY